MRSALVFGSLLFASLAAAQEPAVPTPQISPAEGLPNGCVKRVFEKFCVGADASTLPSDPKVKDPGGAYLTWDDGSEMTMAGLFNGRVAQVARFYSPGTWLTYRRILATLIEKYGEGEDESFYPSYAKDDSSRETSITLKKGKAQRKWAQTGFTIRLAWTDRRSVMLVYNHDELAKQQQEKKKDEF